MKTLIIILKAVVIILLGLDVLFWMAAHASGHKIPVNTDISCAATALILIGMFAVLFFLGLRFKNK